MEPTAIPARFKQARLDKGLTLKQASEEIGVRLNTIWRYENGEIHPSVPVLRHYCRVFEKPLEWFYGSMSESSDHAETEADEAQGQTAATLPPVESSRGEIGTWDDIVSMLFPEESSTGGVGVSDEVLSRLFPEEWPLLNEVTKESVRILIQKSLETAREQISNEKRWYDRARYGQPERP